MDKQTNKTERRQRVLIVLLLLIIVVLVGIFAWRYLHKETSLPYEVEVTAKLGQLENKTEAEILEELNRVVEEGMFHIAINPDPVFADGASEGNLEIENVPNNLYLMRVEIILDETGETIYSTKYIEPNSHIQNAALLTELAAGEYAATAVFYAYDTETLSEMGAVSAGLTLHILS